MPKTHHLKTLPVYFDAVRRGDKTFDIRKNDRDFQTGDTLVLEEFKGGPPHAPRGPGQPPLTREELGYTGNTLEMRVSYVLQGFAGLEAGHVIMGLDQPDVVDGPTIEEIRGSTARLILDEFPENPMAPSERLDFLADMVKEDEERPWVDWLGGPSPVPADALVDFKTRAGPNPVTLPARNLRWEHLGHNSDITAYRLRKS